MFKHTSKFVGVAAALALSALATPAVADDNSRYGEVRINELPNKGKIAHRPWVGSWWSYRNNGTAYRHRAGRAECRDLERDTPPLEAIEAGHADCLSAAEKVDYLTGRLEKVEWEAVKAYTEMVNPTAGDSPFKTHPEQLRTLVRKLNKWIAENPGEDWRETEDGTEYLRLREELDEAREALPEVEIDTATEFEFLKHGLGVEGVQGWWGHCNAWAAASLMEDEPMQPAEVTLEERTITFTPGEVKGLLTETWMEHHASFYGSRHNDPEPEGDEYSDLTPAAFHVYFGTQLGQKKKSFVIDRFTGSEVWNQPMRSYVWTIEKLYMDDTAETLEVFQTEYPRGKPKKNSLGEMEVYPVQVSASIHWITDGVPHEEMTVENMMVDEWPTNERDKHHLWGNHVEMRNLTYTLYLDRPLEDPAARIVGDGVWAEALVGENHAWPDFAWQPLAQTRPNPSRNYENPYVDYDALVKPVIVPAAQPAPPSADSHTFTGQDTPVAIPDNDANGIKSVIEVPQGGLIETAAVTVDITHTYRGDLRVTLSKDGVSHVLHDRAGGGADDLKKTFDLPELTGKGAAGSWELSVVDLAGQDTGELKAWSLELTWGEGEPPEDPSEPVLVEQTFEATAADVAIPDNDPNGVTDVIRIEGDGVLQALSVTVDITHTWRGDLLVVLEKDGEKYTLHNREGRGEDDLKQTFEVSALAGKALRGDWTLRVSDHARRDTGTLNTWSIDARFEAPAGDRD